MSQLLYILAKLKWVLLWGWVTMCIHAAMLRTASSADSVFPKRVAEVTSLIEGMPAWPLVPFLDDKESLATSKRLARQMEEAMNSIAKYDLDEIREAMRHLAPKYAGTGSEERLFIINQYLFAIPDSVRADSPHRKYLSLRFIGMPRSAMTTESWPWEADKNGRIRFSIKAGGLTRMGPPYPAVEVFDYFRTEFGQRSIAQDTP